MTVFYRISNRSLLPAIPREIGQGLKLLVQYQDVEGIAIPTLYQYFHPSSKILITCDHVGTEPAVAELPITYMSC